MIAEAVNLPVDREAEKFYWRNNLDLYILHILAVWVELLLVIMNGFKQEM